MTKYREFLNAETNKSEFLFNATLLKIGENVLQNSNSKDYKIVTLKFNGSVASVNHNSNYQLN